MKDKISAVAAARVMNGGSVISVSLRRMVTHGSSAALLLRDVSYVIEAHFEIVSGLENAAKHLD